MKKEDILELLKNNKVDTNEALVACSCDSAWGNVDTKQYPGITFDDFCSACEEVWYDCNDETGLTAIADKVASYYNDNGELPDSYLDVYDY